jgi:hypothetical protein
MKIDGDKPLTERVAGAFVKGAIIGAIVIPAYFAIKAYKGRDEKSLSLIEEVRKEIFKSENYFDNIHEEHPMYV